MDKDRIRIDILKRRRALPQEIVETNSRKVISKLVSTKHFENALNIFSFLSFDNEIDTLEFVKKYLPNKGFIVPVTKSKKMSLSKLSDFADLTMGEYDILVPKKTKAVDEKIIDLVLVPGIAFDRHGNRIGYGGGYYDRILKKIKAPKIALCHNFQILEKIPKQLHDEPVDIIISEKSIIRCR